jgi:catechol 2,3-dioxygenase-like lactoylglutathione lyase family enzyme
MSDDEDDIPVSLTPPRQRREAAPPADGFYQTFTGPDEPTLRWRDDPTVRTPDPSDPLPAPPPPVDPAAAGNGHDPDGLDLDNFEPARLESVSHPPTPESDEFEPIVLPEFDPAAVDRRDFGEAPPATPLDDDDEEYGVDPPAPGSVAPDGAAASIPQPRAAETPDGSVPSDAEAPEPEPIPADVSAVLGVDDLERSLRFYGEILGFTIIYTTSRSALVELGRTRILLQQGSAPHPGRSDQPQLQVTDVQARYRDLRARGVEFPEPPRALTSGDDLELWLARLRDPDGHELELIEWRQNG